MAVEFFGGWLSDEATRVVIAAVALLVVFIVYKMLSRLLDRYGAGIELEPHALNALRLVLRVGALGVSSSVILYFFKLPAGWFVGGTALVGAFLGFGSSQTINNLVAGFYVLVTQPFKVKDYVKIGGFEGQVEEISINYTNLYTPTFNLLKVPNTQVMNSRILNLTHEGDIKYTFNVAFGHDLSNEAIVKEVIQPAIKEFDELHEGEGLRRPEVYLERANRQEKVYLIRFFMPKGEAKRLYVLQPELLELIMRNWDRKKASL